MNAHEPETVQKRCPHCGSQFRCGAGLSASGGRCWCYELPAVPRISGADCLCPSCLAARVAAQLACDDQPEGKRPEAGIQGST